MNSSGPVIAIANLKGGGGKTVLATHLAYVLQATLLDLDPQGDSTDWANRGGLLQAHHVHGREEVFQLLKSIHGPVVIDTPPGEGENLRTALAVADVVVIPVKPGSSDLRALGRMETLIEQARSVNPKLKVGVVLNEAKTVSALTKHVEDNLNKLRGASYLGHLGDRVAIPEAIAAGKVVHGSPAAEEVMNLAKAIVHLIQE